MTQDSTVNRRPLLWTSGDEPGARLGIERNFWRSYCVVITVRLRTTVASGLVARVLDIRYYLEIDF